MNERLIDLDELLIYCKEPVTKEYIKEAVICYKAGAFRSCIISTWNAVVFDYLNKLRELEFAGDSNAASELKDFETYRSSKKDYAKLWKFEVNIPRIAQEKFHFISLIEQVDLERLNHDRSRSAHPSILLDDEPFQPTPELARYHLRNAVMHFLKYRAVHGRGAIDSIWNIIESSGFPENTEDAIKVLESSYLNGARETLIKDVIIKLTRTLLREEQERQEQNRKYAALEAIYRLHFEQFEKFISNKLVTTIELLDDEDWPNLFNYLCRMKLWDFLDEKQKIKARTFIQNISNLKELRNAFMFLSALDSRDQIQAFALEKLKQFSGSDLTTVIQLVVDTEDKLNNKENILEEVVQPYKDYAIKEFINYDNSPTYSSKSYGKELILVTRWLTDEEIKSVLKAFSENRYLEFDTDLPQLMITFFQRTTKTDPSVKKAWLLVKEKIGSDFTTYLYDNLIKLINYHCSDKEII